MAWRASARPANRSSRRRIRTGTPPAAVTASARRVDQMRSSARMTTRGARAGSGKAGGEVPEDVAGRDDADRPAAVDDRYVAELAHGHLVDRDGHRVLSP